MTDIAHNPHRLSTRRVSLQVNGQEVNVSAEHPHLLAALRDELDITSPKDGCSLLVSVAVALFSLTARLW
jgi:aerobic-type carbon monoxide dehydrogenase small subunit (CoxS/CutS family)